MSMAMEQEHWIPKVSKAWFTSKETITQVSTSPKIWQEVQQHIDQAK